MSGPRFWLLWGIAVVPAGIVGLVGGDIVAAAGEYWWLMGVAYIFTASLLIFSEKVGEKAPPMIMNKQILKRLLLSRRH